MAKLIGKFAGSRQVDGLITSDDIDEDDGTTIYDYSASRIGADRVDGTSLASTVSGDGLKGGGGSSLSIEPTDFAGSGVEDDGSDNLRIASGAAGTGLSGGSGSALSVDYGSTSGTAAEGNTSVGVTASNGLSGGGSLTVGDGTSSVSLSIATDGVGTTELDLSIAPTWTGSHTFQNANLSQSVAGDNATVEFVVENTSTTTNDNDAQIDVHSRGTGESSVIFTHGGDDKWTVQAGGATSNDCVFKDTNLNDIFEVVQGGSVNVQTGAYQVAGTQVVTSQQSAVASLTDNTGATPDGTLASVSSTGDDATINENFAEVNDKIDTIISRLESHGLIST